MEDLAAAMREMATSMKAVKTTVDESQTILRESGTWKPQVDGALQEMCSGITSSLSADARIEPAMDPFDRAISLCEHILAMLSRRVMLQEDAGVDQELADSCDNATSSPDGTVPAKCSTLGLSPSVGGIEAVESSQQWGIVSTVSPGPVGAPPPSTMQQSGILKPDKHTPTTCSTVVLDMGFDAMRAKQDTKTMQANLVYTPTAAAVFPATTPPHPPDQPRLLLDRPPPWPPWKVSFMLCMERHGCCNACNDQRNWMVADHLCGLDEVARLDGIGGTLISSVQALHNVCLTVSVLPKVITIGSKGNSCFHLGNTIGVSLAGEETSPWNKCEATWFIYWFCSQQNTPSWQQRQWHVLMMGSFTPNLSTFTQTFAAHGIECAEFKPQSMLHMIVQAAHPNAENKLPDLRAAWGTCEYLLARPPPDFVAFCGNSSGDLVMLSITVPWDPGVCNELSTEKLRSGFARQQSGELLISASSCDYFACCMCAWAVYCDHLGKHPGAQHQYMALWPIFWFACEKNRFILERMSCWVLTVLALANQHRYIAYNSHARIICRLANQQLSYWVLYVWALGNQLNELQRPCQTLLQKFVAGQSSGFATGPSATWCCCLPPQAEEQWTILQRVRPIGVHGALLGHLLILLQQKPDGWVFLRRILPMTQQSLHCTADLVWYTVSSPLSRPWDPGEQLRQTAPYASPFQPVLCDLLASLAI